MCGALVFYPQIALEVLRAFVTAHENLTGREHFTLNDNIERDRQNVITLATEETSRIKVNFPRLYNVITTVSLCKVVLVSMPKMVKHLHHHDVSMAHRHTLFFLPALWHELLC